MLAGDLARIEALGVRMTCGHRVTDLTAERPRLFDAVFAAISAHLSKHVDIPARDASRIIDAVPFRRDVAAGARPVIGRRVAVYGDGNTAMDAARVTRRRAARIRDRLPAHPGSGARRTPKKPRTPNGRTCTSTGCSTTHCSSDRSKG